MLLALSFHSAPLVYWGAPAVLSILISAAIALPGKARQSHNQDNPADAIVFNETFDPPGDDAPDRTSGVGTRDGGHRTPTEQDIYALMPRNNFGLTFAQRPTVFIEIPEVSSAQSLILTVTDEQGLYYAEETFAVEGKTGLIPLSLSEQSPPLAIGHNYRWHVVLVSGDQAADPDSPMLGGWVQRVATTSLIHQVLQQKDSLEQAKWLGENGYWYDMVSVLRQALRHRPDNQHLQAIWKSVVMRYSQV